MSRQSLHPLIAGLIVLAAPTASNAANVTGQVQLDMELGIGGGRELVIRTPEMCEGDGTARVKWNRNQNFVDIKLNRDEQAMFDKSVAAVKSLIDATNKIVGRA